MKNNHKKAVAVLCGTMMAASLSLTACGGASTAESVDLREGRLDTILEKAKAEGQINSVGMPDDWANGSFAGLVARGNIVVDAVWKNKLVQEICLHPRKDGDCKVLWNRPCQVQVTGEDGQAVAYTKDADCLCIPVVTGRTVRIRPME